MIFENGTPTFRDSQIFDFPLMTDLTPFPRSKLSSPTNSSHFQPYNITTTDVSAKNVLEKNGHNAIAMVLLMLSLMIIIVGTIVGNILVCIAVCLVRKLRRPYNYLLVSLAISDLCVAVLVMPMALLHELLGKWQFGQMACDVWVSFDVLSCTASILNLCMISVDRYLAITKPLEYGVKRTPKRMIAYIFFVWICAAFVSVPPVLILGNEHGDGSICQVCQNFWYQIYATFGSFYIPLTVMVVVYYKIFQAAKRIVNEERKAQIHLKLVEDHGNQLTVPSKQSTSASPSAAAKAQNPTTSHCPKSNENSRCIVVQINNRGVETKLAPCFPSKGPVLDKEVWIETEIIRQKSTSNYNDTPDQQQQCHSYTFQEDKNSNGSQILEVPIEDNHLYGSVSPISTATTTYESSWSLTHNSKTFETKVEAIMIDTNFKDPFSIDRPKKNFEGSFFVQNLSVKKPADYKCKNYKQLPRGNDNEIDLTNCDELDDENVSLSETRLGAINALESIPKNENQSFSEKLNLEAKPKIQCKSNASHHVPLLESSTTERTKKHVLKNQLPSRELPPQVPNKGFISKEVSSQKLAGKRKSQEDNQSARRKFLHPKSKLRITLAKERKASTTLGIIMSAFIICWLPFFVLALVRPFLTDLNAIPNSISSLFLWLGYANSLLNPIIYATLNKDFRKPFQEILCLRCSSLNILMREEFYHSQYGPDTPNHSHMRYCVNPRDQENFVAVGSTSDNKECQRFNSSSQQDIIAESRF